MPALRRPRTDRAIHRDRGSWENLQCAILALIQMSCIASGNDLEPPISLGWICSRRRMRDAGRKSPGHSEEAAAERERFSYSSASVIAHRGFLSGLRRDP